MKIKEEKQHLEEWYFRLKKLMSRAHPTVFLEFLQQEQHSNEMLTTLKSFGIF
jgi:hypothetical protein